MCRRPPGNAGRKKAERARSAKFTGNKPQAHENRRPSCQLGSFCRSQVAVAAVTVGSMNIKSSAHAAVQKLVVAMAPALGQEAAPPAAPARKKPGPKARPSGRGKQPAPDAARLLARLERCGQAESSQAPAAVLGGMTVQRDDRSAMQQLSVVLQRNLARASGNRRTEKVVATNSSTAARCARAACW